MDINETVEIKYNPKMDEQQEEEVGGLCLKIKSQAIRETDGRICAERHNMKELFNKAIAEAFYKGLEVGKSNGSNSC